MARRKIAPGPNQLAFWGVAALVALGTNLGPRVVRDLERCTRRGTSRTGSAPRLTCENVNPNALGVKGSRVQILSARRHRGFPQVNAYGGPFF
jgi:hypothetical protein